MREFLDELRNQQVDRWRCGMTTAWNGVAMPSLRSSTYGYHARLAKQRHQSGQTGRLLRVGTGHGVTINCTVVPHPVSSRTSDGGRRLTACQSGELRWSRYWINAPDSEHEGEDEEEDQDGAGEMEEADSETPSLKYRTVNDRAGGGRKAKYYLQPIGDAEPAKSASSESELDARRGRVMAMNQRRMNVAANMGDRVLYHDWVANTGERRRHVNPPGRVNEFHNHVPDSQLG